MSSIKIKLIVICTAVVLIVMIVSGTFMLLTVKNSEIQKSREILKTYALYINEQIIQTYDEPAQFINANVVWDMLAYAPYDIQGFILDNTGHPFAPLEYGSLLINDSSIIAALTGEEGFSSGKHAQDINGTEKEWLCYAMPVKKGETIYVIFTRMSAENMNENLSQLTFTFIMMVIIALALTSILWFLYGNTLTGPVIALTRHAKEMAAGELGNEIEVHSKDEIGQLTESFNFMAKELNNTVSTMASEKNKSEAILHNMTDGVLAYDASGKIIHANSASGELLQFDDIHKISVDEMLERLGFDAAELQNPETIRESTNLIADRYVYSCVTPYMSKFNRVDGYVIVLQDVTKHTKLDIMRKEFVANVSHELRTPLTSVKTYTETLLDGAILEPDTAVNFLKVIDSETQRMSLLVTDLLELSRLDNKQLVTDLEVVDLAGLLALAVTQNRILAQKKGQAINFDSPSKPYFIEADAGRVNQVLTNILTNSVKYSPENTVIEVFMEETDKYFRVFIKDHGIGIPREDMRRVFERFYRVDKARSRAMGGTGLGLAIAKEIMEEHGGRIYVSSELGEGTTMVLRFNKYKEPA